MPHSFRLLPLSILVCAAPGIAAAQVIPPSSTQPGQVQQRLQIEPERPEINTQPIIVMPEEVHKPTPTAAGVSFTLRKIDLEDLGVFKEEELRSTYVEYLGKKVSFTTLNEIASRITLRYRDAGYILSRAVLPPQQITEKDGIVKIRIVEGYINKVIIEGDASKSRLLQEYADKIRSAKPLNEKTLERYLLLIQDLPGVSVRSTFRPAEGAPGASDVIITISEKHADGNVSLDNRGTRYMGPVEAGATADANNILGLYDRTQFHGVETAEANELRYGQIAHTEQLDSEGTTLTLSAAYTRTHPAYTLAELDMEGSDELYSVNVSHPFIRSRQSNLYGNIQFDVHDTTMSALETTLYNDHLRVFRAGGSYDFSDALSAINRIQGTISQGLSWDIGGNTPLSRDGGQTDFVKANMQVSREQPLPVLPNVSIYIAAPGRYLPIHY